MNQLGRYRLVAELARGGMGVVYLATARGPAGFNKLLVVKELKPDLVDDPSALEMFLEEARLAARLSHPNIVQTYEIGEHDGRHFLVMDYLEGVTLARAVRKGAGLPLGVHLSVLCEMLRGLHYAHTLADFDGTPLGVVHRDVTPQNVFLTYDGQVKLVDFGIAKASDSVLETRAGVLKGKPGYMAPEQVVACSDDALEVDPRADVFAAGVMLWEALAGRRLWQNKSDVEILTMLVRGESPSLNHEVAPERAALMAICRKAMAHAREDRYATAEALRVDLEAYLRSSGEIVATSDVAAVVVGLFEKERAATRSMIDGCLQRIKAGSPYDEPYRMRQSFIETSSVSDAQRLSQVYGRSGDTSTSAGAAVTVEPPAGRGKRKGLLLALAGLAAAAAAGVGFWAGGSRGHAQSLASAAPAVERSVEAATRVDPESVARGPTGRATPSQQGAAGEPAVARAGGADASAEGARADRTAHGAAVPRAGVVPRSRGAVAAPKVAKDDASAPSPVASVPGSTRVKVLDEGSRVRLLDDGPAAK